MDKAKTAARVFALGADHRGYKLKETLRALLASKGYQVQDFGTNGTDSCDYPDYGIPAAQAVASGKAYQGVLACATGNGMAMSANKVHGVRAALCFTPDMARLARQHNDANVLVLSADFISERMAKEILEAWLGASFEGGRHQRRIDKVKKLEG